ncbi:Sua5/YciO/YrdC/YwlC family protein [Psychrobacter frigidicola]|uniref:Threonylcarbamoyl-AMP synthase n=1 Tax=Psychrobacter frigidicola TaxID=45611 RepID=A0A5C7A256_9GAMM|nr:Sua5/YciO/YrdC/YwlC family protein [Psychrobacter frigidicola]TXD96752.1 Sua5/YciO/YrdC/YwlC family protein [Psychrobacter frigidicola]
MKISTPQTPCLTTDSIIEAAEWLSAGNLLAYPTESVWGIGCDPFNESAVQQLLAIKQRPVDKGMIVITDDTEHIAPLLNSLNSTQRKVVLDSWQLPLDTANSQAHTWLLPLSKLESEPLTVQIPAWITGAHNSVAVRVTAHPLIQQLCAQLVSAFNPYGFIVSTSCNPSGQPPALSLAQAQTYFADNTYAAKVGYLQGDTLGYQLPSQINDALTGQIIR